MIEKPLTIILMGSAGSGKGTQADLLKKYLKEKSNLEIVYVSAGDGFRKLLTMKDQSFIARKTAPITEKGGFHKDFLVIWTNVNYLIDNMKEDGHLLIDSPRLIEHEPYRWDDMYEVLGRDRVFVLYFKIDADLAIRRLLLRARHDDREDSIRNRLKHFDSIKEKLSEFYKTHSRYQFIEIDASKTPEEIHEDVLKSLEI